MPYLLSKGELTPIKWDDESNESFQTSNTALTRKPILTNFEKHLLTEESDTGQCAVLVQENYGVIMPVMYISRKRNGTETRYSTIERECLVLF